MISKIIDEAQKLMNKRKRQAQGNQDFIEGAVDTLTTRTQEFPCI